MTDEEFARIHTFLKQRYGIDMSKKKEIVTGRMENYIYRKGFQDFNAYMNAVEKDISGQMEKEMVNILTTNHTFFMREFEHFEFLRNVVLPYLHEKEAKKKDLAIWCGAASTGQEPYMIAMTLMEYFGLEHKEWDTQVLATDLSTEVLQQAIQGEYTEEQIEQLPQSWKRRFLRQVPGGEYWRMTDEIKEQVLFRQFNLMEPFPFRRRMHVIFLRNVMIYFDHKTKRELIQKVYDVMEPGGYLFIGRTETLERGIVPLDLVQPSIFRKREA